MATTKSKLGFLIAFSCFRVSLGSEIQTGFENQRIGVGLEALWILLRVKSVWKRAEPITIHEVAFHFHVPEFFEVNPRRDHFVVDVIEGQAGIGLVGA